MEEKEEPEGEGDDKMENQGEKEKKEEGESEDETTPAKVFNDLIIKHANIGDTAGDIIASFHDLPLQVQHYRVPSVSLWAQGNHFPVLHTMLGPKRPSQGHMPHVHCPCVLECQGTMQGVLSFLAPRTPKTTCASWNACRAATRPRKSRFLRTRNLVQR